MRDAYPKIYRSYEEFERDELRRLDGLAVTIDDMLDDMFAEELDFDESTLRGRKRGGEDDGFDA